MKVTTDGEYWENYATVKAVGEGEADVTLTMGTVTVMCHVVVEKEDSLE